MKKEKRNRYLFKNTLIFAIGNFATKFISFFLIPLYTNILTTEEYGIVDLIYTICTVLVPLLTLNISEAVLRFSMDKDADNKKIMSIGNIFIIASVVLGIASIPILNCFDKYKDYSWYFYMYLVSLSISQVFLYNLKGREQLIDYSVGNFIHSLLIALFNIVFLAGFKWGIKGYFLAYIISNLITSIFAFIKGDVISSIKSPKVDKKLLKEMTKYSVLLIPNSFMWWIMNSSDRIMVTQFLGVGANGIYAISYKLPTLLTTVASVFTHAWIYSAVNEKDSEDNEEYTNSVFKGLTAVVFIIGAGLLMIIKPFLKIYVTSEFYKAWKYTPFLTLGFVFLTLASFLSTSYNVNKDSKGFLYSGVAGAIINVCLNFILIPIMGIQGAAVATAFSYICVLVYRAFDTKKYVRVKILSKEFIIGVSLLALQCATIFINTIYSQLLLILEFILIVLLFKKYWKPIVIKMKEKCKRKIKSK